MTDIVKSRGKKMKWVISALCALLFFGIVLFLDQMGPVDSAVYGFISRLTSPIATSFFSTCTAMASPVVLLAASLLLVPFLSQKEYRVPLLANLAISLLLNLGLKDLFARVRPSDVAALAVETGYSFPSGHTMAATCFYGFLIFLVFRSSWRKGFKYALAILLMLIVALVGVSRIYLGVHYFSDVFAGLCCSIAYLILFTAFVDKFFTHHETLAKKAQRGEKSAFISSFRYAFEGIAEGLRTERNMVVHFAVMSMVVVFGVVFGLSKTEWMICVLLFGLVFMAELLNTAVETVVDMITTEYAPRAKLAKDTAAGAVLTISIAAGIVGLMIFLPKVLAVVNSGLLIHD